VLIAIDAIPDLFATILNVTGDLVATVLIASWQGGSVALAR
jgi:Na+/H+-dicarboxylate symporter